MCYVRFSLHGPPKDTSYNMRKRKHDLTLPTEHSSLQRKNFVYRMLFTDILVKFYVLYAFRVS